MPYCAAKTSRLRLGAGLRFSVIRRTGFHDIGHREMPNCSFLRLGPSVPNTTRSTVPTSIQKSRMAIRKRRITREFLALVGVEFLAQIFLRTACAALYARVRSLNRRSIISGFGD